MDEQDVGLAQLREQLMAQQAARRRALRALRTSTEAATACTPLNGTPLLGTSPLDAAQSETADSGIRQLPPTERLDARREQLILAKNARKEGLSKLKQTTCEAIRVVRDTTLMDVGELKRHLDGESSVIGA